MRAAAPDRGNDRVAEARARHGGGTDYADAIGRAFAAGLLGDDGHRLRDTARAVWRVYWSAYRVGGLRSALGTSDGPGGDGSRDRERWLAATLDRIGPMGKPRRRAFDELVLDMWVDAGPPWLDRLVYAAHTQVALLRHHKGDRAKATCAPGWVDQREDDLARLSLAIEALEAIAG